jgi:lysophospholipase L1-like esterase
MNPLPARLIAPLLPILALASAGGADLALPWSCDLRRAATPEIPDRPAFDATIGYGFEAPDDGEGVAALPPRDRPPGCRFDIRLPPGDYRVTVGLRGAGQDGTVTIMAELRRLMVQALAVPAAGRATATFVVNIRDARLDGTDAVALNQRERTSEAIAWDDRLTLRFLGAEPRVETIAIAAAVVPTVFIAGDSTVCDQPRDPYASWGQMLPRFFGDGVAIANHAESGSSVASFLAQRRMQKVLALMRPGDHLLLQFGHNDMKDARPDALATFAASLTRIIAQVRERGGQTTLITPVERYRFYHGRSLDSLDGYPDAMKQVAQATGTPLIDLHAMSHVLYDALGPEAAVALFKPGGSGRDFDHTHHSSFGAYELARCIVQDLRDRGHPLAALLAADALPFDPAHPDRPDQVVIPAVSAPTSVRPLGD